MMYTKDAYREHRDTLTSPSFSAKQPGARLSGFLLSRQAKGGGDSLNSGFWHANVQSKSVKMFSIEVGAKRHVEFSVPKLLFAWIGTWAGITEGLLVALAMLLLPSLRQRLKVKMQQRYLCVHFKKIEQRTRPTNAQSSACILYLASSHAGIPEQTRGDRAP